MRKIGGGITDAEHLDFKLEQITDPRLPLPLWRGHDSKDRYTTTGKSFEGAKAASRRQHRDNSKYSDHL